MTPQTRANDIAEQYEKWYDFVDDLDDKSVNEILKLLESKFETGEDYETIIEGKSYMTKDGLPFFTASNVMDKFNYEFKHPKNQMVYDFYLSTGNNDRVVEKIVALVKDRTKAIVILYSFFLTKKGAGALYGKSELRAIKLAYTIVAVICLLVTVLAGYFFGLALWAGVFILLPIPFIVLGFFAFCCSIYFLIVQSKRVKYIYRM